MKAPDKIIMPEATSQLRFTMTESVEYIRKDVMLEWANKRLEEFRQIAEISNDVAADGEVDAFEELIDKLNEM